MSKKRGTKRDTYDGYCVWTLPDDYGQYVGRVCGDYFELTPLKGAVITKPGIIGPDGVVPDELKNAFNDGVSPENASIKLPMLPGADPVKRQKVWLEVTRECIKRVVSDQTIACAKEEVRRGIKDMNLGSDPSSSGELNNNDNNNVVEKGTGSSSEELMGDNDSPMSS